MFLPIPLQKIQRKKLFGNNIAPRCEYCQFASKDNDGNFVCQHGTLSVDTPCKRYVYDPLKREPKSAPTLPKFTADDFKL